MVAGSIGTTAVTFLLDTGAPGMLVLPQVAEGLNLPPGPLGQMLGTGGGRLVPQVLLSRVAVGGAPVPPGPAPVAPLPGVPRTNPLLAGIVGAPLAVAYDLDVDVPAGRLALYEPGCAAPFPAGPAQALAPSPEDGLLLPVELNGQPLLAVVDTGSRATLLSQRAADRLGLGGPVSANTARGVDGEALTLQHIRVRSLRLGTEVLVDTPVSITPLQTDRAELLLGLDVLGRRRFFLSYATARVTFALPGAPLGPGPSAQ